MSSCILFTCIILILKAWRGRFPEHRNPLLPCLHSGWSYRKRFQAIDGKGTVLGFDSGLHRHMAGMQNKAATCRRASLKPFGAKLHQLARRRFARDCVKEPNNALYVLYLRQACSPSFDRTAACS